jgi:hypothetical protein
VKHLARVVALIGLLGAVMTFGPPAHAAGGSRTVHVAGTTHYLTVVENNIHGNLRLFRAYYQDGYVHGVILPSNAGRVTDLEHFTCVNPESHGPPCAASSTANDALLPGDPESLGTLGQAPTGVNHNVHIDFRAAGIGPTLQWRTYEHRGHTQLSFTFADGFELYVVLDTPIHLYDLKLVTQPTTSTSVSHAVQTAGDTD